MTRLGPPLPKKFSGDFVGRVTPVPIPNTEVKPAGADGTARETVWESRKSPGLLRRRPARMIFERAFLITIDPDLVLIPPAGSVSSVSALNRAACLSLGFSAQ